MAHKLFSLLLMLALPVVIFAFAGDEAKAPAPAEVMQKQIADAIKVYGEKKEVYRKDVLGLFERKEKFARDKGDLKTLNLIKKEKDAFFENGKDPTLFFVTDQRRFLELAKLDLIKAYEKTIKECVKMKLDVEAEGFSKELEEIRAGKINAEMKVEEKKTMPIFLEAPFSAVAAKTAQMELAKSLNKPIEAKIDLGKGVKLELVLIPAGKFMMGSPESEVGRRENETQHEVTLTKPFYMGKYEVTQEQWQAVMGNNPSSRTKGAKLPVTDVSWEDCQDFIKKLNAKTRGGYRLPTEAEREYACRAGTTIAYSFGDKITPKDANYGDSKIVKPVEVGSYNANAFSLYDMHGNVWEWCADWHGEYPFVVTDPKGPATGKGRVLRGGSFFDIVSVARSSFRGYVAPSNRYSSNGFRLASTADFKVSVTLPVPKPDLPEVMPTMGELLLPPFSEAKAKEKQLALAKSLQKEVEEKEDLGKGVKLEMVLIPAGKFMMGSPASEVGRKSDETEHEVTLTKPFYMGKYEVTQDQWLIVMGNNPSQIKGARLPVTNVSWNDCQDFIKKLNGKTNGIYRLPTEAEWEYACRAGTKTEYAFGGSITKSDANYDSEGKSVAVGVYKPNAFGLYDMHGNVFEWCKDWYADYPTGAVTDTWGPATGKWRVLRGGSFRLNSSYARSSIRHFYTPNGRFGDNGFRLARTP